MPRLLTCLLVLSLFTACASGTPPIPAVAPAVLFKTSTPSLTPSTVPTLTGNFLPTATVTTYKVVEGDSLNGIASRFNITLEALVGANPGFQMVTLSAGTELIIPAGNATPSEATPTPAQLPIQGSRCWPEQNSGQWCFALMQNEYAESLENISAQFTLLDAGGQVLASQTAYALLNTLPPGGSMALAVHFPPVLPADVLVSVQLLTAIRLLPGDVRYLPVMLDDTLVTVDASGRSAQVSGRVILTGGEAASTLWVLATAFDGLGEVVGLRRWESTSTLTAEDPVQFDFQVSSVGPTIERVEFLAEARP
jgi:hypothetical protein